MEMGAVSIQRKWGWRQLQQQQQKRNALPKQRKYGDRVKLIRKHFAKIYGIQTIAGAIQANGKHVYRSCAFH